MGFPLLVFPLCLKVFEIQMSGFNLMFFVISIPQRQSVLNVNFLGTSFKNATTALVTQGSEVCIFSWRMKGTTHFTECS